MNKEIKKRWLKALRSGEYKQGKKALKTKKGFCCLGVLCDIYSKTKEGRKNKAAWKDEGEGEFVFTATETEDMYTLPLIVQRWAGLDEYNPAITIREDEHGKELSVWNDDHRIGFKGIANKIEKYL